MFENEILIGVRKINLDQKGRAFIPNEANITESDRLVLIRNISVSGQIYLSIEFQSEFDKKIEELSAQIDKATSIEDIKKCRNDIHRYYTNVIASDKALDKQRRFQFPEIAFQSGYLNANTYVIYHGMYGKLLVFPSEDVWFEHTMKR